MITVIKKVLSGFEALLLSLKFVLSNSKLIAFSAPSTLWSFFASPLLFGLLTKYNYLNLPGYIYVFLFSFLGLIIFNFIYLGLAFFQLIHLTENKKLSLATCISLSWNKIHQVVGWAFISSLIGTSFFHTSGALSVKADMLSYLFLESLEFFWWLINFLIIPVLTTNHTLAYAASSAVKIITSEPALVVSAGGGLLVLKKLLSKFIFFQVIMRTPLLLAYLNIISFKPTDKAFLIFVLMPVIGILVATCISIILSAVEATLATGIYAKFIGKAPNLERSDFWGIFFVALLVFIILVIMAFSIATSVILLSATTPLVKDMLLKFLS